MHIAFLSVAVALASLVSAQSSASLPTCAQTCVGDSLGSTGCSSADIACICKSKAWISQLSCCISKACNAADQTATIAFAQSLCSTVQVTVPTVAGCSGNDTSSSNTTSTTAGGSGSSSSPSKTSGSAGTAKTAGAAQNVVGAGVGLGLVAVGLVAGIF